MYLAFLVFCTLGCTALYDATVKSERTKGLVLTRRSLQSWRLDEARLGAINTSHN